jgi:hypothetical protein
MEPVARTRLGLRPAEPGRLIRVGFSRHVACFVPHAAGLRFVIYRTNGRR